MAPSLLLFFLSSVWVGWSVQLMLVTAVDGQRGEGESCWTVQCGNLTIAFPFKVVPDEATETAMYCGRFGYIVVQCQNSTPYLGSNQRDRGFQILDIFYGNTSLLVADVQKLQDFVNNGSCRIPTNSSSTKLADPMLSISPLNRELILYSCTKAPPPVVRRELVVTKCGNNTYFGAVGRYNESATNSLEDCDATVVPVLAGSGTVNASRYVELISDGFLLTWQLPVQPKGVDMTSAEHIMIIVLMAVAASLVFTCIWVLIKKRKVTKHWFLLVTKTRSTNETNIEAVIISYGTLAPKRYKHSEVVNITSSLKTKLGEGGYGKVFKGKLNDGRLAAVKFLHKSKGNGEDFVNEVMSIGRTSHVNIVSLFGFCLERSRRALIYEYMPNGSLDQYIYSENPKEILGWQKLYSIAIGIARGLEYLHHSCNTRIIHFDIKPQNNLLDQDFCPKIADFGLAKLCIAKESKLSMTGARGTIGFIAPEVHSRTFGVVSTKSDVYGYGMMLLEMVGGRKNVRSVVQKSSEQYFPDWIHDHFAQDDGLEACEVTSEVEEIAKKMTLIGLWCIQILPMHRPTVTQVLEMFERDIDKLDMPPKQNFSQILEEPVYSLDAESTNPSSS